MTEAAEQKAFVQWWQLWSRGKLGLLFAIPNERKSTPQNMAHMKAMGLLPGVPDIMILWPRLGFHGLFIEMKSGKGRATLRQKEVHETIKKCGYAVVVCKGCDEAIEAVKAYGMGDGSKFVGLMQKSE